MSGIFANTATGRRVLGADPSPLQKAEMRATKAAVLRKYKEGQLVTDPTTGAVGVVDSKSPTGITLKYRAGNAHNHLGSVTLGDGHGAPVSKSKPSRVVKAETEGRLRGLRSG